MQEKHQTIKTAKMENKFTCDGFEGGKNKTNESEIRKSR